LYYNLKTPCSSILNPIPVNEITLSLETLTVQGIQALEPNDNYCPKQPIPQNTPHIAGVAAVSTWRNARAKRDRSIVMQKPNVRVIATYATMCQK